MKMGEKIANLRYAKYRLRHPTFFGILLESEALILQAVDSFE